MMKKILIVISSLWFSHQSLAADAAESKMPTIHFSANADVVVPNNQTIATLSIVKVGKQPMVLSQAINQEMAQAIALAKQYKTVQVKTGQVTSFPLSDDAKRWQLSNQLILKSTDAPALSELLGQLQAQGLVMQGTQSMPDDATRDAAEAKALDLAMTAFKTKADAMAKKWGKQWKIQQITVGSSGGQPYYATNRAAKAEMMADSMASPMPIEAGEGKVNVNLSGSIFLY